VRVLLTGASGFVGSHLAHVLVEAGCDVQALVRPGSSLDRLRDIAPRLTVLHGDVAWLATPDVVAGVAPDLCIHLAWYAEPGRYLEAIPENLSSLRAGLRLVEALAGAGCRRFVGAGTCAEYGTPSPGDPLNEGAPIRPATPYARAKSAFCLVAQDVATAAGMEWAWARLFFLYGPGEHPARIMPSVVRACLEGETFAATSGEQVRDYLHVSDVATGLWALAASATCGPVNVCSGEAVTLRQVIEAIEAEAGCPGAIRFGEKPYGANEWMWMVGDSGRLRATGWEPRFSLDAGVADAVSWWRRRVSTDPGNMKA
jgi:nucleoside-diphosphate-sugar epimerase